MFGFKELKPKICIAENTVDCPVNDCKEKVDRQRHKIRRDDRFKCPKHGIFISPSTFEYEVLLAKSSIILEKYFKLDCILCCRYVT